MYLHREFIVANRVPASISRLSALDHVAIDAAVLRGRKMRAEAAGRLIDAAGTAIGRSLRAVFGPVLRWHRETEALRQLRRLDIHMLADIGLAPGEIKHAARYGRRNEKPATPASSPVRAPANDREPGEVHAAA